MQLQLTLRERSSAIPAPLRDVGVATLGPTLLGAALGLHESCAGVVVAAIAVPTVMVGVAMLMAPALYIGMTMLGEAPQAKPMATAITAGLRDAGIVLFGFALPVAFLSTSTPQAWAPWIIGGSVVAFAVALGLRAIHDALFRDRGIHMRLLFVGWSLVGGAIGARLLASVLLLEAS